MITSSACIRRARSSAVEPAKGARTVTVECVAARVVQGVAREPEPTDDDEQLGRVQVREVRDAESSRLHALPPDLQRGGIPLPNELDEAPRVDVEPPFVGQPREG